MTIPKRWKSVKGSISLKEVIVVNFSDNHGNYYSAYRYTCKDDNSVHHSKHHPNLDNVASPQTKKSTQAYRQARKSYAQENPADAPQKKKQKTTSRKRLTQFEVSEFLVKNNIHRDTDLFYEANKRKSEGQTDFAAFLLFRSSKSLNDLIENTWKMNNAKASIEREKTTRMEILMNCQSENCVDGCEMVWYECARQVLQLNSINSFVFADAMRDLLARGKGKFRNVLIVGPANCGKTLLLKPLEIIFWAFMDPENDKYAWVSADQPEMIVLQDFKWSSELICWKDFLHLLEGENVKLPSPKNQFATDVCINTDIPIFATSKAKIDFVGKRKMMGVRWNIFEFTHRIPQADQKIITPCPSALLSSYYLAAMTNFTYLDPLF